jgi:hypothetical protein
MWIETSQLGQFQTGDWIQIVTENRVYYGQVWPSFKDDFSKKISRVLTETERKLELKDMGFAEKCIEV